MLDMQSLFDGFMIEDDEDDLETDTLMDVQTVAIRAQFILDGCATLAEASDAARAFADYLDSLADNGYELVSIIQDDRGLASLNQDW